MESSASEPLVVPEVEVLAIEGLLPLVATRALMGMMGPSPAVITASMGVVMGGESRWHQRESIELVRWSHPPNSLYRSKALHG